MPFNPTEVDWENPGTFYLGDPEMATLADVTIKHSGQELPAHTHVLALQSRVLRQLFCSLAGASSGKKRNRDDQEPVVLETLFSSHTLQEVLLLLRLMYMPTDATPEQLSAVVQHLPGIVRLAHALDVPIVLAAIDSYLAGSIKGQKAALEWLPLAEACQLDAGWAAGVRVLAGHTLTALSTTGPGVLLGAQMMLPLSQHTLTAVLAAVAAGVGRLNAAARNAAGAALPSVPALQRWQSPGVQHATYTWRVEDFMQQQGRLQSPLFGSGQPGSRRLQILVYPFGTGERGAGHVSAFIQPVYAPDDPGLLAKMSIELVHQTGQPQEEEERFAFEYLGPTAPAWGNFLLISREELEEEADTFLVGGAAVFKADVTWVEQPPGE